MATEQVADEEAMLRGQADLFENMFGFVQSMAVKCAIELRIADIINNHGCPITLTQIISAIDSPSPDINCLSRIMRLLVRKRVFSASPNPHGGDTVYGLTPCSILLQRDADLSLAPLFLMLNHPWALKPWHYFSNCVREGGYAFEKAHGKELWDFTSENPEFNMLFNDGMACTNKTTLKAILSAYKGGFEGIGLLVDVGGGTGAALTEIVKAHPQIRGINFDLPNVVAAAPPFPGVTNVGGDMFESIPQADAVFLKFVLHDWSDEDCVKILKNCLKSIDSIPEKTGKVIIAEVVVQPDSEGLFDRTGLFMDLLMMALTSGGKERTEAEWRKLLTAGGFSRYKIIKIPALISVIEAYPV